MRASLAYRNSVIYPETGKTIAQTLLGRHLRDALPQVSIKEFLDTFFWNRGEEKHGKVFAKM